MTSSEDKSASKASLLAPVLFAILAVGLHLVLVVMSLKAFGAVNDLPEYYTAARLVMEGKAPDIYVSSQFFQQQGLLFNELQARRVPLFLPPIAVPLLVPIAIMPVASSPLLWLLVLEAALVVSILLVRRCFALDRAGTQWLVALTYLAGATYDSTRIGQISPLMLLAQCGAMWAWGKGKDVLAGVFLSLLCVKPQYLGPWFLYLVGARRWKSLGAITVTCLVLGSIAYGLLGQQGLQNYINLVSDPASLPYMQPELNPTFRGQMLRFGISPHIIQLTSLGILALASCVILFLGHRYRQSKYWVSVGLAVMLPLALLTSYHTHEYDLLLLMPGLVALCQTDFLKRSPTYLKLVGLVCMMPFMLPFYADVHYKYLKDLQNKANPYFFILLAFALFLAMRVFALFAQKAAAENDK